MSAFDGDSRQDSEDVFAREQAALDDAALILEKESPSPAELRDGLKNMRRQYERLLRLTRRLTEMSDNSHRELMEITEFKNHLMGMAAHDIRTPVGIMMGFSQILHEDREHFSEQNLNFLEKIRKQGEGLLNLLDDLLTLSQTESGSIALDPTTFELSELLGELTESSRVVAEKKNIALMGDYAEPTPIYADRDRLTQVFNNLIGNAIKYSHAETSVHISLGSSEGGDRAIVTIADQGLGIPPEDLQNIFRPFHHRQSTDRRREKHGPWSFHRPAHRRSPRRIDQRHEHSRRRQSLHGRTTATRSPACAFGITTRAESGSIAQ